MPSPKRPAEPAPAGCKFSPGCSRFPGTVGEGQPGVGRPRAAGGGRGPGGGSPCPAPSAPRALLTMRLQPQRAERDQAGLQLPARIPTAATTGAKTKLGAQGKREENACLGIFLKVYKKEKIKYVFPLLIEGEKKNGREKLLC